MTKEYAGKYFSVLGDSVSTLAGFNPPECKVFYAGEICRHAKVCDVSDTWWGRVIEELGGTLLVNNSFSGSLVSEQAYKEADTCGCSDRRTGGLAKEGTDPNVVMIFLGVNDWGREVEISAPRGDLSAFGNAYPTMIEKIKGRYPEAEIWCLTLCRAKAGKESSCLDFLLPDEGKKEDYCRIIRACADERVRVIELFEGGRYETVDGLHPDVKGMEFIANSVLRQIRG